MQNRSLSFVTLFTAILFLVPGFGSEVSGEDPGEVPSGTATAGEIVIEDFTLQWSAEASEIEITVSAPTTGWIAVGFEPSAAMKDADIIMGYISDGEVFLRDDWGDGYTSHKPDTELGGTSDISVISGSEENGTTEITFSRQFSTGDGYDRDIVIGNTVKVLLAYGPDEADDFQGYHAWAETVEMEF